MKYYAIKKGIKEGIFTDWNEVRNYVSGFKGAEYKSFKTEDEAKRYLQQEDNKLSEQDNSDTDTVYFYTDGSFKNGITGYGICVVKNGKILFKDAGKYPIKDIDQQNVAGEIFAIIRSIQIAKANGFTNIVFAYDYEGIEKWVTNEWRTKQFLTKSYVSYFNRHIEGIKYRFQKVEAHTGNTFNEEADKLAKLGTTL